MNTSRRLSDVICRNSAHSLRVLRRARPAQCVAAVAALLSVAWLSARIFSGTFGLLADVTTHVDLVARLAEDSDNPLGSSAGSTGAELVHAATPVATALAQPTRESHNRDLAFKHDFGLLRPHQRVTHSFNVTNDSEFAWTLRHVERSCACTVANCPVRIAPGTSEPVEIEYRGGAASVDDRRAVELYFHERGAPVVRFIVEAAVRCPVALSRKELIFHGAGKNYREEQVFEAANYSQSDWKSVTIKSDSAWLTASASLVRNEVNLGSDRQIWLISASVDAGLLTEGTHTAALVIQCDGTNTEHARLPVSLQLARSLQCVPERLFFGTFTRELVGTCKVRLVCNTISADEALRQLAVEHDFGPALQVTLARRSDRHVEITGTLTLPPSPLPAGNVRLTLSNDPRTAIDLPVVVVAP